MNIEQEIEQIKNQFYDSSDFASRLIVKNGRQLGFVFLKSITDGELFIQGIVAPILNTETALSLSSLQEKILNADGIEEIDKSEIVQNIIKGSVVVLLSGEQKAISIDIQSYNTRAPSEPPTSSVIMGPREGFTEDIKTNMSLMRRRLATNNLVIKQVKVGKYSNTKVAVTYLQGIVSIDIVEKVISKLKKIQIDGVLDSHYLVDFLQEHSNSIFRQVGLAEKPDIVASKLLEGKVAIMVDNSPIVLTLPFLLFEDLQDSNDYYTNHHYAGFIRTIRMMGVIIAIVASGLYLALQLYHYNILPLNFLVTIADTTQGLPFTPFLEILFIFLLFQILYEVSLRLPSYLGLATSVVGALILGDTGVKAGLISPPGVIIVAMSKIALYVAPAQNSQIVLLQLIFIVLGGSLGLLGIVGGLVYFTNYLNSLDSYGVPYLAPYSPRIPNDLQDGLFKKELSQMHLRPESFNNKNKVRIR